jgi:hypothetical protein
MKFKCKDSLKEHFEILALADISKMSSINYLARTNVGIEGLVALDAKIKELEAGVWSLLPLGLSDDESMFDNQAEHITKLLNSIIIAGKAMRLIKK